MTARKMTSRQIRDMLIRLKRDRNMTDIEWYKFCKRYASRDISTVVWLLTKLYGNLPKGIGKQIQEEMKLFCASAPQKCTY